MVVSCFNCAAVYMAPLLSLMTSYCCSNATADSFLHGVDLAGRMSSPCLPSASSVPLTLFTFFSFSSLCRSKLRSYVSSKRFPRDNHAPTGASVCCRRRKQAQSHSGSMCSSSTLLSHSPHQHALLHTALSSDSF